jgi:ferredoxin-NADP reductase
VPAREIILPVVSVRKATPATRIVRVALGSSTFAFKPGQAAFIGLAESDQRVPYSLACSPDEARERRSLEFLIKVEPSGRWGHKFDRIGRGQKLAIRGPFGSFVLPAPALTKPLLFVAGGTGIAPIRSMIAYALRRPHRSIKLLYSARTNGDLAYAPELRTLGRRGDFEVRFHATREAPERWRGERGRIAPAHLAPLVEDRSTLCFVCGPTAMVADLPVMLTRLGVPPGHVKLEQWAS